MTSYEQIRYDVEDGLLTITLNRPERMNAYTRQMKDELIDAFDRSDDDDDVRAVIVTGAGRAFCAGADVSAGSETFAKNAERGEQEPDRDGGGQGSLRIYESLKPVIGAINGAAVGIGMTLTLPMDIRLASDRARFGGVFVRLGLMPEAGSTWFLPRLVGHAQAAEWLYTGRVFDAEEALQGRLVHKVYEPEALLPAARALGREIADNTSAVSVAVTRRLLWRGQTFDEPYSSHLAESRALGILGAGADAREGVAAFLEKRAPLFPGRVSEGLPDVFSDPQPSWAGRLPWADPSRRSE
jgi:enoyl-CoA hydratase/carnithine racemase